MILKKLTRSRKKELGLAELIAIALGGMVGGGIFSILGISVERIGNATPIAIAIGGLLAMFAAYSYVKLALLYKDEGATYSFFKKTFPNSHFASSAIGWLVVFGYISTLALYAFTFSTYLGSVLPFENAYWINRTTAGGIILLFTVVNLVSVKGMGKVEDVMVYTKIILLLIISGLLAGKGETANFLPLIESGTTIMDIIIIASITFVAFEGFQLVIHAYDEMDEPVRNIPRAIYSAILIATLLYVVLAIGALATIPKELIIQDKEYALAAGAQGVLGGLGRFVVIFGALLATSSAISGTLFGASRLMAVIAHDGYLPEKLADRSKGHIPHNAIIAMSVLAFVLILSGGLQIILEFGSITFITVSLLMAYANFRKRKETHTHGFMAVVAMLGLLVAGLMILWYEWTVDPIQLGYILGLYILLGIGAFAYSKSS
jgi:amino acid transporter